MEYKLGKVDNEKFEQFKMTHLCETGRGGKSASQMQLFVLQPIYVFVLP